MRLNVIVPRGLFVLVLVVAALSCTSARPTNLDKLEILSDQEEAVGTHFRDLFSAGNTPRRTDDKKRMKNSSGKSDEGGLYKTYGSDAEGEKGYIKKRYSNGDHGYKTLDTFHKKDGDNYGFEEHSAIGNKRKADKAGKKGARKVNRQHEDHEGAGTDADSYYVEEADEDRAAEEAEADGDASGESASYSDGGEYYSGEEDRDAGQHNDGGSDYGNYENSDGYNEHYSRDGGDEGSYGSHESYTADGDSDGEAEGYSSGEYF